jgi:uncharacterized RDD family membrane protein YckC
MVEGVQKIDLRLPKERKILNSAPVWKRIASFFIDLFIIELIIFGPFTSVIQNALPVNSDIMKNYELFTSNPDLINQLYLLFGIIFLLVFAYFVLFEYKLGQTPGKMIFRLYLSPVIKNEKISFLQILIRNAAVFPVFPFSLLWIIDPLYLIFTGKRLSDIFSKTQVVEEIAL